MKSATLTRRCMMRIRKATIRRTIKPKDPRLRQRTKKKSKKVSNFFLIITVPINKIDKDQKITDDKLKELCKEGELMQLTAKRLKAL